MSCPDEKIIRIGEMFLSDSGGDSLWIGYMSGNREGEGGAFAKADLEKVIKKFYTENF